MSCRKNVLPIVRKINHYVWPNTIVCWAVVVVQAIHAIANTCQSDVTNTMSSCAVEIKCTACRWRLSIVAVWKKTKSLRWCCSFWAMLHVCPQSRHRWAFWPLSRAAFGHAIARYCWWTNRISTTSNWLNRHWYWFVWMNRCRCRSMHAVLRALRRDIIMLVIGWEFHWHNIYASQY